MIPKNLEKLWQLAKNDEMHFEPVGLILPKDISNWGYDATPTNAITFATTGGDGVHYSFICNEVPDDDSPIVMTVPMNNENIIVGENIIEFLALGCRYGYFALEQLSFDRDGTIDMLDSKNFSDDYFDNEKELLGEISSTFLVQPWNNHAVRLKELESKYFNLLISK